MIDPRRRRFCSWLHGGGGGGGVSAVALENCVSQHPRALPLPTCCVLPGRRCGGSQRASGEPGGLPSGRSGMAVARLRPGLACVLNSVCRSRGVWAPVACRSGARAASSLHEKQRTYWQYLRRKVLKPPAPPYSHICRVGDPILRSLAAPVEPARIAGGEVQALIQTLVRVMRRQQCVALSAPQVGVPLQVFVTEYPERLCEEHPPSVLQARQMAPFPLRVFVNPTMRVLDSQLVSFPEGCQSISGFSACVARYRAVQVSGLDESGKQTTWQASGWAARIIQHEMDHLQGVLYIDKMESRTFVNLRWAELNE